MFGFVCAPCGGQRHENCNGARYCDCQCRSDVPVKPAQPEGEDG